MLNRHSICSAVYTKIHSTTLAFFALLPVGSCLVFIHFFCLYFREQSRNRNFRIKYITKKNKEKWKNMTNKKSHDACQTCKVKQTLKSGWGSKSPPHDQLKKKRFRRRWLTLSIVEICKKCWLDNTTGSGEESRQCLMLSYYKAVSYTHLTLPTICSV